MKNLLLVILALLYSVANAQTRRGKISVTILNDQQSGIENATVELLKAKDSSLVKIAITDKNGLAEFQNVAFGNYVLKASVAGRVTQLSSPISLADQGQIVVPGITLQPDGRQLGNVTVTAKKPFIQKLNDRIVVNVENSIVNAGSSAMDVLERSPGVNIDQNDNITLIGRSGVIIMIDGKPSAMAGSDLANYLKGLPSAAIERIDIITNPSAKYDAAGNAGIIDIRMKKDQRFGYNGSATAGYGQGIYPKANAGTTFNYRNKKINVFGNYNYAYFVGLNHLILDRNFFDNGTYNGGDLKDNYSVSDFSSHTVRFGTDIFPGKKSIIGFVVNGNFSHIPRTSSNHSIVLDQQKQNKSTFESLAANNDHNNNMVANVNFKHTFDTSGKEITADLDYGDYNSHSLTTNATKYYKLDGSPLQPDYVLDGDQHRTLHFKTAKSDYVNPLKKGARWEAGFKTSFVTADNDAKFFDVSSGTPEKDLNKTNHFFYKENNHAGYLNYGKQWKRFNLQVGLRGEQTNIKTHQLNGSVYFDSSYFQLFPSAFLNYKVKDDETIGFSVSRRIGRPGYSQLNPFLFLIDPTTYATGSPGLLPEFTWSYEVSYTKKNLNFTFGYSHTIKSQTIVITRFKDVFPNIPSGDNVTVQIPVNLSSTEYYGVSISAPIRINKWWNMINNANIYYQYFNGRLGITVLDKGKPAADLRTNSTFIFKKGWTAEFSGSVNSGGQYGFMVTDPQWGVGAGVQRLLFKNKGTVRFNITDIFWTNLPKAIITYNNYIEKWHAYRETRVANLTFTYRFGNSKVQQARRRTTASEEERQRAGN